MSRLEERIFCALLFVPMCIVLIVQTWLIQRQMRLASKDNRHG